MPKVMVRWEYLLLSGDDAGFDPDPVEWLNKQGAEGWELVQFFPEGGPAVIFKRAILVTESDNER